MAALEHRDLPGRAGWSFWIGERWCGTLRWTDGQDAVLAPAGWVLDLPDAEPRYLREEMAVVGESLAACRERTRAAMHWWGRCAVIDDLVGGRRGR